MRGVHNCYSLDLLAADSNTNVIISGVKKQFVMSSKYAMNFCNLDLDELLLYFKNFLLKSVTIKQEFGHVYMKKCSLQLH